jgi:hypothetical protein
MLSMSPNKITGANAGGPLKLAMRTPQAEMDPEIRTVT